MRAAAFFARYGFREVSVDDFEPAVGESFQCRGASSLPDLARRVTAMRLTLTKKGSR